MHATQTLARFRSSPLLRGTVSFLAFALGSSVVLAFEADAHAQVTPANPDAAPPPSAPAAPPPGLAPPAAPSPAEPGPAAAVAPAPAESAPVATEAAPGLDVVKARAAAAGAPAVEDTSELAKLSLEDLLSIPVVTASGASEERSLAAANVTVIGRKEIRQNGFRSVAEALESVPGLYLTDDGSLRSVAVRGVIPGLRGGTRLIKIMINGTQVNFRPDLRAFIGPEYIPIEAVEQIEIVKGPLSALYGANAFIATINVITRKPKDGSEVNASGTVAVTNGEPGYGGSAVALYGGKNARLLLSAAAGHQDRTGLKIQKTFEDQDASNPRYAPFFAGYSEQDTTNPVTVFAQLAVPSAEWGELSLDAGLQQLDSAAEFQLNSVLTHRSRESLRNYYATVRHEASWTEHLSTKLSMGLSAGDTGPQDRFYLTGNLARTFTRNFGYRALDAGVSTTYSRGDRVSARLGVDVEVDREDVLYYSATLNMAEGVRPAGASLDFIPEGTPRQRTLRDLGAYLQVSGKPFAAIDGLTLLANARVDSASYDAFAPPPQLSARGGIIYEWAPELITKAIVGRAFQSPNGVLMFAEPGFSVERNVIGNLTSGSSVPQLTPQTLTSAELTTYAVLWDFAVLEVSAYAQSIADKIEFVSAGTDYVARNLGEETFLGVEGTLRGSFGPFRPFVGGSYIKAVAGPQRDYGSIIGFPELSGVVGADLEVPHLPLFLNGRLRFVGARGASEFNVIYNGRERYTLPSYYTIDATVTTDGLPLLGEGALTFFSLSGRNILDQRYSEAGFGGFDVPAPRASGFFEARQTF
jgi:outer membrane receptor protein involved in Fe transport